MMAQKAYSIQDYEQESGIIVWEDNAVIARRKDVRGQGGQQVAE